MPSNTGTASPGGGDIKPPRRFRTAYNYFFMYERAVFLESQSKDSASTARLCNYAELTTDEVKAALPKERRRHVKTKGMAGLKDTTARASDKWKSLSPEDKKVFNDLASEDLQRWQKENQEYKERLQVAKEQEEEEEKEEKLQSKPAAADSDVTDQSENVADQQLPAIALSSMANLSEQISENEALLMPDPIVSSIDNSHLNQHNPIGGGHAAAAAPSFSVPFESPVVIMDPLLQQSQNLTSETCEDDASVIPLGANDSEAGDSLGGASIGNFNEEDGATIGASTFDGMTMGASTFDGMTIGGLSTLAGTIDGIESIAMESFPTGSLLEGDFANMSISTGDLDMEGEYTVIYESQTTRVVYIKDPDNSKFRGRTGGVVLKMLTDQFPSQESIACLDNEYKILERLTQFRCDCTRAPLQQIKNVSEGNYAIQLEWAQGITLKKWTKSFHSKKDEVSQKADQSNIIAAVCLAWKISMSLAEIHASGVVHNKIASENVIVGVDKNNGNFLVKIIDFSLASVLEQDGHCSFQNDLESLGTILYELFSGIDPLQIASSSTSDQHTTRTQDGALNHQLYSLLTSKLPPCISSLVLNLMEKRGNAYHYNSATNVVEDLYNMLSQPNQFLFETDIKGRLKFSTDKLYGREEQMRVLTEAYGRISQSHDISELVLIVGYSGAGKSALVQHFKESLPNRYVNFLSGKFEQRQQTEPLSAIIAAFRGMCDEIVKRDQEYIDRTKTAILQNVGSEIGVLANLLPSLRDIIGEPIVETKKIGGVEALNQFKFVFRLFVRAISSPTQPLLLFLDDLQWADSASLELITSLITDSENSSLLLIGSYRENEVSDTHPLNDQLQLIQKKAVPISKITVGNISREHVNELISDTLQTSPISTQPLADIVYRKTSGNVLFVVQFLRSLCDEGLLRFLYNTKQWQWNIDLIESKNISDDAVELMSQMLLRMPTEAVTALKIVACLGLLSKDLINCLMANTTKSIRGHGCRYGYSNLVEWLNFSVDEGLMDHEGSKYIFAHDQIQQAAYSLIPENERGLWHVQIGTHIWANKAKAQESVLYTAVGQLNQGETFLTENHQRTELARLNLQAGEKAMSSAVYILAASFLKSGIALLNVNCWEEEYTLSLKLYVSYAEVSYCNGDFETMNKMLDEIFTNAKCYEDKHPAYFTLIRALGAQDKLHKSIETALFVLEKLGEPFPASPDEGAVASEFSKVKQLLEGRADVEILGLSEMESAQKIAAMQLLSFLVVYAVLARVSHLPLFSFRMVQLTLKYGVCNESAIGFGSLGFLLCGSFNDIKGAYHHGQLALRLVERLEAKECMARTHVMVYGCIHSWVEHHRLTLEPLQNAYTAGMRCGDIQYALFCAHQYYIHAFQCGEELSALEKVIKKYADQMLENKQNLFWKYAQVFRQTVLNWMGRSNDPLKLTGEAMNQDELLKDALENKHMALAYVIYHNRTWLALAFGNYELATELGEKGQNILDKGCSPTFSVCCHAFVYGIASFVLARKTGETKWTLVAHECMRKMGNWNDNAPSNCRHKLSLLQAESLVLLGETKMASAKYDAAVREAEGSGFIQELALVHERAAMFYLEQGDTTKASYHYGQAHDTYLRWGAEGKADNLRINYPF